MNQPESELVLRPVEQRDARALTVLARENLHSEWSEEFVQWKYFQNPAGRIHGCCAELAGELVGFYGSNPIRIKMGDDVVDGVQAVDAMVASSARRQGLFSKLGHRSIAEAAQAGVTLAYAIANPISRAGSVKRLAFGDVGEVPRYVRALNLRDLVRVAGLTGYRALVYRLALRAMVSVHGRLTTATDGEIQISQVDTIDGRFDTLWASAAVELPVAVVRDRAYLTWRYVHNPLAQYAILTAERSHDLRGYAILSHRDLVKGVIAIAELLVAPGDHLAGMALLARVATYAMEKDAVQVQCWMLPQHMFYTDLLRKSGFIYSDVRFVPGLFGYTTSLIARTTTVHTLSPDPLQLRHWYLTMGDQDYY